MSAGFDLIPFVLGCVLWFLDAGVLRECAAATFASGWRRSMRIGSGFDANTHIGVLERKKGANSCSRNQALIRFCFVAITAGHSPCARNNLAVAKPSMNTKRQGATNARESA